jgi:hypothetical protein
VAVFQSQKVPVDIGDDQIRCEANRRDRPPFIPTSFACHNSWDRCYDFKIFSPKNLAKILAFIAQTTITFCKNMIIKLVFEKTATFFRRKLAKIVENYDRNIDPCIAELCL